VKKSVERHSRAKSTDAICEPMPFRYYQSPLLWTERFARP